MKNLTRILSLILVLCTFIGMMIIPAQAASANGFSILSSSRYAKVWTINRTGTTIPYTSKYLSTRGTVSYGANSSSYIDNSSDELHLISVGKTNGKYWALVSYPTSSNGRVKAYIPLSAICSTSSTSHTKTTASGKFYCGYRYSSSINTSYYVEKGDTVYRLSTRGERTQILYPSGNVYRIAWCRTSDYNKYCASTSAGASSSTSASTVQTSITYDEAVRKTAGKTYVCPYCKAFEGSFAKTYWHAFDTECFKRNKVLAVYWDAADILLDLADLLDIVC